MLTAVDRDGEVTWERILTGRPCCIAAAPIGGYIIAGSVDTSAVTGRDIWILKTDASGNVYDE